MMRIMQVGLGDFGRSWTAEVCAAEGCQLVAVVDPSPIARQWAHEHLDKETTTCYESLGQALASTVCDAVLVVTPESTHFDVARTALEAGRHVLIEKPLTTSVADARSLAELGVRTGRIIMASQNYRFQPAARMIQQFVAEGVLGTLRSITVNCQRDTRSLWPTIPQRYQMRHPYVIGMAIHHFDLLRMITANNVRQLYARSWRVPDSPYRYDPAVVAVMELENGVVVSYSGSWATHTAETSWNGEWEVLGDSGRVVWRMATAGSGAEEVVLHLWGQAPRVVEPEVLPFHGRAATLQALRTAVASGQEPETGAADNANSVAILESCLESLDRGDAVRVHATP